MMGIIWILIGVVLMGLYNGLLLLDNKTPENDPNNKDIKDAWHSVGAAIFIYLSTTAWFVWDIAYVPFALSSFWLLFAGIVHKIGLKKPFFYVGTTAKTDILLRKLFPKNPELGSAILKSTLLVMSLIILIFL